MGQESPINKELNLNSLDFTCGPKLIDLFNWGGRMRSGFLNIKNVDVPGLNQNSE